jgi:hypothetical protein
VVTWVALTIFAREFGLEHLQLVLDPLYDTLRELPVWFSTSFAAGLRWSWGAASVTLLFCWFEPLLLRLNLARGLAWLGVKVFVTVIFGLVPYPNMPTTDVMWRWQFENFVCAAGPAVVLIGWRARPWMTVTAAMLHCSAFFLLRFASWRYDSIVAAALYSAALLYGTRELKVGNSLCDSGSGE